MLGSGGKGMQAARHGMEAGRVVEVNGSRQAGQ
jgi:hypothetical protein